MKAHIIAVAALALAGCKKEQIIVAMPLVPPQPPAQLMAPRAVVDCNKIEKPKAGTFRVEQLEKINGCNAKEKDGANAQLAGLQQSVRTRWSEMEQLKKKAEAEIANKDR